MIMAQLKCTECGHVFEGNLKECPNCGCPAGESKPSRSFSDEVDFGTTDTGYEQEKTIKTYADIIWWGAMVIAAIIELITVFISLREIGSVFGSPFMTAVGGTLLALCWLAIGILVKAFLYIYANISINIHEINMKTK